MNAASIPSGWKAAEHRSYPAGNYYEHESARWYNGDPAWVGYSERHDTWLCGVPTGTDRGDTRSLAMCAALSIEIIEDDDEEQVGRWMAHASGAVLCSGEENRDECARVALEAFHTRNTKP
jgi:hypothetical protein